LWLCAEEIIGKTGTFLSQTENIDEEPIGILEKLKAGERIDHMIPCDGARTDLSPHIAFLFIHSKEHARRVVGASRSRGTITRT